MRVRCNSSSASRSFRFRGSSIMIRSHRWCNSSSINRSHRQWIIRSIHRSCISSSIIRSKLSHVIRLFSVFASAEWAWRKENIISCSHVFLFMLKCIWLNFNMTNNLYEIFFSSYLISLLCHAVHNFSSCIVRTCCFFYVLLEFVVSFLHF